MGRKEGKAALGQLGEDLACAWLEQNGHTVLARNWRSGHLEIDIISKAADGLHFAEVKSRTAPVSADPEDNVGPAKRKKITSAALRFLSGLGEDLEVWFDIVSVVFDGASVEIEHYPGAWLPIYV